MGLPSLCTNNRHERKHTHDLAAEPKTNKQQYKLHQDQGPPNPATISLGAMHKSELTPKSPQQLDTALAVWVMTLDRSDKFFNQTITATRL